MTYFVQLKLGTKVLGAGFLVNRHWAVTAYHCVKRVSSSTEIELVSVEDNSVLTGRIEAQSAERDLAIIEVTSSTRGRKVPAVDRAADGVAWKSPYRPTKADPFLVGSIHRASVEFECEGGGQIAHGMQLRTDSVLRNYSGYSGSPIERESPVGPTLVGVLIEQSPDRVDPELSSNILWAAGMREVISAFGFLFDRQFEKLLDSPRGAIDPTSGVGLTAAKTRSVVNELTEFYSELETLSNDPNASVEAISTARARIPSMIIKAEFGDNVR
jgi:hypothetical protein